jgi:cyclic-di-GMP-binding protein
MAPAASFDVTSTVDLQEVDNALNQARKEVAQRYDLKGARTEIAFNPAEKTLVLTAEDRMQVEALWDVVQTRLVRRSVPVKNFKPGEIQPAAGGAMRRTIELQQGIPTEAAREIVKFLKDQKLKKVQAAIQSDQVRVSAPSKDDLQEAIRLLRSRDFGIELQFGNYRS